MRDAAVLTFFLDATSSLPEFSGPVPIALSFGSVVDDDHRRCRCTAADLNNPPGFSVCCSRITGPDFYLCSGDWSHGRGRERFADGTNQKEIQTRLQSGAAQAINLPSISSAPPYLHMDR